MSHLKTTMEHGNIIAAEIKHAGETHPIRVNLVPRGSITRVGHHKKHWDPTERRPRSISLTAQVIRDAIAVLTDKRGFTAGLRARKMTPPDWQDAITSIMAGYLYNKNLAEIAEHLDQARQRFAKNRRTLAEIEKQFRHLEEELDERYTATGFSLADRRQMKANAPALKKEWELIQTIVEPRLKTEPSGATSLARTAVLGSTETPLNVSSVSTTFPAVIVPVGSVVDYKVTDEGGHTCDQWCFKKTLAAIEFTYTVDLPDIPYAYLHVHDWWHWHDKWWDGYPHVHTHWHTGWIVMDVTFRFTTDIYFEICLSATGASIVIGGVACASVNGATACCTVEAVGVAGIRVTSSGSECDYGLGADLRFSCEVLGYDLPTVTIPLAGVTVRGPCVRQC